MSAVTSTCRVHFANELVSDVFVVPRKTESEAKTLFYQPEDCDRFRSEARLEKLTSKLSMDLSSSGASNIESLNALAQLARYQFKSLPSFSPVAPVAYGTSLSPTRPHCRFPRGASGTACIA
ncbi:expressed unknown protein [Seminavis robusta]|uniref:Uncharacterized protein n=1 Tax=Seminavis robusta TaxID=568900 RepID=A0A9N8EG43_9STRA|nr:expressed unknown protein [Seminavis robusta]|eukprot:Sro886_g216180.1 n/a (122) ;mRNA; r:11854-12219